MYEYQAKIVNVVDGDTVDALVDLGFKMQTIQRLRLARVDTPERNEDSYQDAKTFVQNLIGNKNVFIRTHKVSKWGYFLADIEIDGRDVADTLIATGLGVVYSGSKK